MSRTANDQPPEGAAILGVGLVLPDPTPALLPSAASPLLALGPAHVCGDLPLVSVLPARAQRRLGRAQRLALGAAQQALDACPQPPGPPEEVAVIVGTGLGCLGETAGFLENMVQQDEREPMPARFINSVHNAPAAQISIAFGFRGENLTFTHESISFELALWQALALLRAGRTRYALVVGVDEISPYTITALRERTTLGEGAAALLLGPAREGLPRLLAVRARPLAERRPDPSAEADFVRGALLAAGRAPEDVDLILCGSSADGVLGIQRGTFGRLCGEFCTAPAVGFALAARGVREGRVPDGVLLDGALDRPLSSVAVYHLHEAGYQSIGLIAR